MKALPNKPSKLLRLALKDLEWCEKHDEYVISMEHWHKPMGSTCYVCLAGSVIAHSLEVPSKVSVSPVVTLWNQKTSNKLIALNYFRQGAVADGLRVLELSSQIEDFYSTSYAAQPDVFKREMRTLAEELADDGL